MTPKNLIYAVSFAWLASMVVPVGAQEAAFQGAAADLRASRPEDERQAKREAGPTERFSRTFRVGKTGILDLSNTSGDVTVTGGTGEEIVIEALKRARSHDSADAKSELASVSIEAAERGGRVEVRTVYTRQHVSVSVDFTIRCPTGTAVYLKSVSGDVSAVNIEGELTAEAVSGDVHAERVGQVSRLTSVSGDIDITGGTASRELRLSSVSGNVIARKTSARSLDLSTVSGDVQLTEMTSDRVDIRTVSGDVAYSGELAKSGRYEFKSHSGDLQLGVVGAAGFELSATTFSGTIRSDLPLTLSTTGEGGSDSTDRRHDRSVHGTFGDAGAVIVVTTFSGDVTLVKR
jgi:DUF4097 and DUF4098 domain-containing protein YvlB